MPCAHSDNLKISCAARCANPLRKADFQQAANKESTAQSLLLLDAVKTCGGNCLGRLVGCGLFAVSREGLMTFTPVSPWHQRAAPGVHVVLHLSPARSHALPEL